MVARVTSLQVAKRAGVSQSAVSRVFTPGASASAKTTHKVRMAADELGYRPNVIARSLITGKSRIIAVVLAYMDNYFYASALEKLSNALQLRGYHVLVFMASNTSSETDKIVEELLDYQVDGIIAASVGISNNLASHCQNAGVPIVLFNRAQGDGVHSAVTSDNFAGGRMVAQFLLAGEHQRIAYIGGWEGALTQRDREAGFRAGLAQAGRPLDAYALADFDRQKAEQAARDMFNQNMPPSAVFVATDHMAIAVMDVLRSELGLRIPQDVSVVGYDDAPPAAWAAYDLTTVRQRLNVMVNETVSLLTRKIENPTQKIQKITIDSPLIVRGSARLPKEYTT